MATNKPIFYRSITEIEARATEIGIAAGQFTSGCNRGVANGAIGINTGDYDPKETDFSRSVRWSGIASYIGRLDEAETSFETRMVGLTNTDDQPSEIAVSVGFDTAASDTAPGADYGT
jgi:hypothetical protein